MSVMNSVCAHILGGVPRPEDASHCKEGPCEHRTQRTKGESE
jgi:hypothetical protein